MGFLGKKNIALIDNFEIIDADRNIVTGLVQGDFTIKLYNPSGTEVSATVSVTITELGNGSYRTSFTPNANGDWVLIITNATYFPWGKRENYQIYTQLFDDLGPGNRIVNIIVKDVDTSLVIVGAWVEVYDSLGLTKIASGYTGADGIRNVSLYDGSYKVYISKIGSYIFSTPFDLTVLGNGNFNFTGNAFSPSAPVSPDLCVVYGWVKNPQDGAKAIVISATLAGGFHLTDGGLEVVSDPINVTSDIDDDGYWELALLRSSEYYEEPIGYVFGFDDKPAGTFLIPDQDTVEFSAIYKEDE